MDFKALFQKLGIVFIISMCASFLNASLGESQENVTPQENDAKLYWFIPDGMRSDPDLFNVFQWAQEGKLPNIKKMMERGSYGYSIPTFPSHTPTNFATLFTGTYPAKHGVSDGPMHTEGSPLSRVSVGGFNSAAKKNDPIWVTMENTYDQKVVLLSVPGSTPPELDKGITIRGRWGGWGADFHATNFQDEESSEMKIEQGRGARLFFFGPPLIKYLQTQELSENAFPVSSFSKIKKTELSQYGKTVHAYIYDSTDNEKQDYDRIAFSIDKIEVNADLKTGEWSDWIPVILTWKVNDEEVPVKTSLKIKIIKLEPNGFFRVRIFYNNLNEYVTKPSFVADEMIEHVGPMVDFVDNFPAQLIFYDEDKDAFIEEAHMSLDWHKKAVSFILDAYDPDILINDIYTPNQMLTSRWWMGYIDPKSARYGDVTEDERSELWNEVKDVYKKLDDILGELLKKADQNTYVVLSSDHGAVPIDKWVRLNNLFAQKGWLKFEIDDKTGEPVIDWEHSQVIYLKMAHVYISPDGLGGNWKRASGENYIKLREEVRKALFELEDTETHIKPVIEAYNWEDAPKYLKLPTDRIGDLVIVNKAGYGWNEEMTSDKVIFDVPLITGYKQAILADEEKGMWTPFLIVGPGVKKGFKIQEPIRHVDQYLTIMTLLGKKPSNDVDGAMVKDILE